MNLAEHKFAVPYVKRYYFRVLVRIIGLTLNLQNGEKTLKKFDLLAFQYTENGDFLVLRAVGDEREYDGEFLDVVRGEDPDGNKWIAKINKRDDESFYTETKWALICEEWKKLIEAQREVTRRKHAIINVVQAKDFWR